MHTRSFLIIENKYCCEICATPANLKIYEDAWKKAYASVNENTKSISSTFKDTTCAKIRFEDETKDEKKKKKIMYY